MVKVETLARPYIQQEAKGETIAYKWHVLLFICSFFLSRTVFFDAAVPFFISLYAVISLRYPFLKKATLFGGLAGALTLGIGQAVLAIGQLIVWQLLGKRMTPPLALRVLLAIGIVQVFWQLMMYQGIPPAIVQFYVASEAILGMVMTLFLSFVLLPTHRFFVMQWNIERLLALFVIAATLLTGMASSTVAFFNIALIIGYVIICIMAVIGGVSLATVAATVFGLVIGMSTLSFSGMIALYAVTGLVAGSCKGLGKWAIAPASFVPSVLFFLYDATLPLDIVHFSSISVAAVIFLCTPTYWTEAIARFISPNNEQTLLERQKWLSHHMAQSLQQFQQFVFFIKDLTFERFQLVHDAKDEVLPYPICADCYRYAKCWQGDRDIEQPIVDYYAAKYANKTIASAQGEELLRRKCVKADALMEQIRAKLYKDQMEQQLFYGRKMIATQLQHMSEHIYHLLDEMQEVPPFQKIEEQLIHQLQQAGFPCFQIDIFRDSTGSQKIHVACTGKQEQMTEWAERILLPILFENLAQAYTVEKMTAYDRPFRYMEILLKPAQRFQLLHKVYKEKKGMVSGDTHAVFDVQEQLVALVLSDGVGYDKRAKKQSGQLVSLLKDCLAFMPPETAMHTVHYALSLEQDADLYATLDFAIVDLQQGTLWSWKAGSVATYIVRGKQVLKIEGNSPPFGFMPDIQIETATTVLQHGDLVLMVSDGLFDGQEGFMIREKAFLKLLKQQNRQKLAVDVLLYDVIAQFKQSFVLEDDCTLLACRVQHIQPEWSVLNVR